MLNRFYPKLANGAKVRHIHILVGVLAARRLDFVGKRVPFAAIPASKSKPSCISIELTRAAN
jgi:hypothetical protein